jgi:hypothetical protein
VTGISPCRSPPPARPRCVATLDPGGGTTFRATAAAADARRDDPDAHARSLHGFTVTASATSWTRCPATVTARPSERRLHAAAAVGDDRAAGEQRSVPPARPDRSLRIRKFLAAHRRAHGGPLPER